MRHGRVVAAIAAIALPVAGCGGGGSENEGDDARLSKAQLIQKADEICGKFNVLNDRLRARGPSADPTAPSASERTRKKAAEVLRAFAANVRKEAGELGVLRPPVRARAGFDGMIRRLDEFADHLVNAAEAVARNERRAFVRELAAAQRVSPVRDRFPARYGFRICGRAVTQQPA